jgi:flavodoxin
MNVCIIYHSESGNTRHVAQHIAEACRGQLIEVTDKTSYNRITGFLVRCKMARGEETTAVEPGSIDVSGYDQLIFGSPVWAFKPTPAIHAAIDALKGCEGKRATAFCTHGGKPGQTAEVFQKWIEARGMKCVGNSGIHQKDIENEKKNRELIEILIKDVPSSLTIPVRCRREGTGQAPAGLPPDDVFLRKSFCPPAPFYIHYDGPV